MPLFVRMLVENRKEELSKSPALAEFAQIPSDRVGGNASPLPLQGVLAHGLTESYSSDADCPMVTGLVSLSP